MEQDYKRNLNDQLKLLKETQSIFLRSGVCLRAEITAVMDDYLVLRKGDNEQLVRLNAIATVLPQVVYL